MNPFTELNSQLDILHDLILTDMIFDNDEYTQETLDFNKHLLATKSWFMRISFANKKRYLLALLNDITRAWTLSLLLKSIWNCRPKDSVMSICQRQVWSPYDRPPLDHNRSAMSTKTLAQSMINDRKWFLTLDPERQAFVLTDLLTVSGGPVIWEVFWRSQILYERYRDNQFNCILQKLVVTDTKADSKAAGDRGAPSETGEPVRQKPNVTPTTLKSLKDLEVAKAAWDSKLKQLRDSQKLEEVEIVFKDGTKNKIWKVNRPKPEGIETSDFLQLLPSSVAKRILSHLDQDLLPEYAKVNKYWAFLIESYKTDRAARHKLNDVMATLRESMLEHDTSAEMIIQPPVGKQHSLSATEFSMTYSSRSKTQASLRAKDRISERSIGFSFKHFTDQKLRAKVKVNVKRQTPIRNLRELTERLDSRGAADCHLWCWCDYILKQLGPDQVMKKREEGVLQFKDAHFPSPMMKCSIAIPIEQPLIQDPVTVTTKTPKIQKNILNTTLLPPRENRSKRYHLWSRNFSELYTAIKVPAYQTPF